MVRFLKQLIHYDCLPRTCQTVFLGSWVKWGREELNLQCLPRGNGFTVRRNTANRCRFPEMRRHLTPYLCMRLCYAYSIKSAQHHRKGRTRTGNYKRAPISHKKELNLDSLSLSHWATFRNRHQTVSNNIFRALRCTIHALSWKIGEWGFEPHTISMLPVI